MPTIALLIAITLQGVYPYPVTQGHVLPIHDQNGECVQWCASNHDLWRERAWSECHFYYPDDPQLASLCFALVLSQIIEDLEQCRQSCRFDECVDTDPPSCFELPGGPR